MVRPYGKLPHDCAVANPRPKKTAAPPVARRCRPRKRSERQRSCSVLRPWSSKWPKPPKRFGGVLEGNKKKHEENQAYGEEIAWGSNIYSKAILVYTLQELFTGIPPNGKFGKSSNSKWFLKRGYVSF